MPRPNSGPKLATKKGRGVWYIRYYECGQKREHATGIGLDDRGAAEAALATFIIDRHRAEQPAGPADPSTFLIDEALTLYALEHAPTTAAPARIAYAIEALARFWEDSMVSTITRETCRRYARERERSDGTIRRELGTLRAALNHAFKEGRLMRVPHVFLPEAPDGKQRWLTRGEEAALLHAAVRARSDTRLYLPLFIVMALYTGARKEALLSLRWPQVDLHRRLIDFNPPGTKRTSKGRPVIPIPDRLMTFLRLAKRRGSDLGYVIHNGGRRIRDVGGAWDGSFAEGEAVGGDGSFGRACRRAGLRDVTPHTLRHTCGTWMAHAGVPLFEIAGWLGHSAARTTELYAHQHPSHLAQALRAADRRR